MLKITETKEGTILEIFVKPQAREFKIVVDDEIVVYCRGEPVKGKVNKELISELSTLFHKEVELVSGFTSKQKRLLVKDTDKREIERVLELSSY